MSITATRIIQKIKSLVFTKTNNPSVQCQTPTSLSEDMVRQIQTHLPKPFVASDSPTLSTLTMSKKLLVRLHFERFIIEFFYSGDSVVKAFVMFSKKRYYSSFRLRLDRQFCSSILDIQYQPA
jgi:hypothetical protein